MTRVGSQRHKKNYTYVTKQPMHIYEIYFILSYINIQRHVSAASATKIKCIIQEYKRYTTNSNKLTKLM